MAPNHFQWELKDGLGIITLNRPERKNPLTFDSYAELRDTFRDFSYTDEIRAVIINGAGGNFCSGGDVHEIIGPLTKMSMKELLAFTRDDGRSRQSHQGMSTACSCSHRWDLCWCRRRHRHGLRPTIWNTPSLSLIHI